MNKKGFIICLIAISVIGLVGYFDHSLGFAAQEELVPAGNSVVPHTVTKGEVGQAAICPVCDKDLTVQLTTPALEYQGQVYYFDSTDCAGTFTNDPDAYVIPPES